MNYLFNIITTAKKSLQSSRNTLLKDAFKNPGFPRSQILKLLESECDIHHRFEDDNTFLHYAISNQWMDVAGFLIEKGLDVNCENCFGETPLHWACQLGLVNEIWMLLGYSADPNIPADRISRAQGELAETEMGGEITCFDIAALSTDTPHMQEIFLDQLNASEVNFNLMTFYSAMVGAAEPLVKLLEIASDVNYTRRDSSWFFTKIQHHPDLFQLFLQKFEYVVEDLVQEHDIPRPLYAYEPGSEEPLAEILLLLFDTTFVDTVVEEIRDDRISNYVNSIIGLFDDTLSSLKILTPLLCCMLSYGVDFNVKALNQIYFHYGYCELFKILLHVDFVTDDDYKLSEDDFGKHYTLILPQIIYDVNTSVHLLTKSVNVVLSKRDICQHFTETFICVVSAYFTLPQSVKFAVMDQCKEIIDEDKYEMLIDAKKFPTVPTLVELSRNCTRDHIIHRYKIKNCWQFRTLVKSLSIPLHCKEIISFERNLYPFMKDFGVHPDCRIFW